MREGEREGKEKGREGERGREGEKEGEKMEEKDEGMKGLASFPVLHHSYRIIALFVLQATIAVVEDWERGYEGTSRRMNGRRKALLKLADIWYENLHHRHTASDVN